MNAPEPTEVTQVAQDLSAIERLAENLLTQAVHEGGDAEMPGGKAMAALAHVANLEAYARRVDTHEASWLAAAEAGYVELDDQPDWTREEDGVWEPPLQTLCFWSEHWRVAHNAELDRRPTIGSEASFLRWALHWAWEHEVHFAEFARDVRDARRRLEDVLRSGIRAERGVPCMYDECKGVRLARKLVPYRKEDGTKSWRHTDWFCPRCRRTWDEDVYARNVAAAHERTKSEDIAGQTWCTVELAARRTGRSTKTIRTWMDRNEVATVCIVAGRRSRFVCLDDVAAKDERAERRAASA